MCVERTSGGSKCVWECRYVYRCIGIHQLLTITRYLLKVDRRCWNKFKEDYISYVWFPSNLLYFPSTVIGSGYSHLASIPRCYGPTFHTNPISVFDEHGQRDGPCEWLQILVASGFYSGSIFCTGARLRLDVISIKSNIGMDPLVETVWATQGASAVRT